MGSVLAPIVNEVEYPEYDYRVVNGVATLSIPIGEALSEPESAQSILSDVLATADRIHGGLEHVLGMLDEHIPEAPLAPMAPVVDIEAARGGPVRPRKSHRNELARTGLTPRSIN
jgi:hypothetical protein